MSHNSAHLNALCRLILPYVPSTYPREDFLFNLNCTPFQRLLSVHDIPEEWFHDPLIQHLITSGFFLTATLKDNVLSDTHSAFVRLKAALSNVHKNQNAMPLAEWIMDHCELKPRYLKSFSQRMLSIWNVMDPNITRLAKAQALFRISQSLGAIVQLGAHVSLNPEWASAGRLIVGGSALFNTLIMTFGQASETPWCSMFIDALSLLMSDLLVHTASNQYVSTHVSARMRTRHAVGWLQDFEYQNSPASMLSHITGARAPFVDGSQWYDFMNLWAHFVVFSSLLAYTTRRSTWRALSLVSLIAAFAVPVHNFRITLPLPKYDALLTPIPHKWFEATRAITADPYKNLLQTTCSIDQEAQTLEAVAEIVTAMTVLSTHGVARFMGSLREMPNTRAPAAWNTLLNSTSPKLSRGAHQWLFAPSEESIMIQIHADLSQGSPLVMSLFPSIYQKLTEQTLWMDVPLLIDALEPLLRTYIYYLSSHARPGHHVVRARVNPGTLNRPELKRILDRFNHDMVDVLRATTWPKDTSQDIREGFYGRDFLVDYEFSQLDAGFVASGWNDPSASASFRLAHVVPLRELKAIRVQHSLDERRVFAFLNRTSGLPANHDPPIRPPTNENRFGVISTSLWVLDHAQRLSIDSLSIAMGLLHMALSGSTILR